ncbi:hypothetical protein Ndes2437A_g02494 [Nannochloris sp. 'desiccata']
MPLVRPGGATWSLTPPPSSFAADTADAAAPSFVEINTSEKGETSSQTTTQYTLAILERYLTTFDTFESSSHTAPAAAEGFKHDINGRGAVGCGCGIDADTSVFSEALERLSEHVTGDANGMAACLICLEDVKPTDPIWHCSGGTTTTPAAASLPKFSNLCGGGGGCDINGDDAIFSSSGCYALLHLPCAQAWARQQLQQQQVKQQKSHLTTSWGCPKCRQPYSTVPTRYSCFCRKVDNPNYNPWHVAHSCGEECAVENPVCGHPCMLLCHPGPHPPCPRVIQASCYCGKERTSRRCGKQEFSCQAMCGRKRTATGEEDCVGRYCEHPCPALCHPGECPPCIRLVTSSCRCGGTTASEIRCSTIAEFRCEKICQKLLPCGKHHCKQVCCDGERDVSKRRRELLSAPPAAVPAMRAAMEFIKESASNSSACPPCGVMQQGAVTPTTNGAIKSKELCCTKQCLKQLAHCPHLCEASCHEGPCPGSVARCEAETTVRCSCKRLKRKLKCFEVANLLKKARKNSAGIGGGGHGGDYDSMTSLRLLLCDDGCAKSITTKMSVDTEKPASTSEGTTTTTSTFAPSLRLEGQKKCLLNNERAAEAARKERDREKKRLEKLKQKKIQQLIRVLLLFTMFIIIVCGSVLLRRVLSTFDEVAQEAWGGDNIL